MMSESPWLDDAARLLGAAGLRQVAAELARGTPTTVILRTLARPDSESAVRRLLDALGERDAREAASYLNGIADGMRLQRVTVESVWTGPTSHAIPVRDTSRILLGLINSGERELILTTYSAKPHEPLLDALRLAIERGARISVLVETLRGAGSALSGAEPATAFVSVPGVELWHWPIDNRQADAKMHAKIAVSDRKRLLVTSANLTGSGIGRNLEAGLLVEGGTAPARAAEHLLALQESGVLRRL